MIFIPEGPTLVGALAQEYERVVGDEKGVKNSQPKGRNDRTWATRSETAATKVNVKGFISIDLNGTTQQWLTQTFLSIRLLKSHTSKHPICVKALESVCVHLQNGKRLVKVGKAISSLMAIVLIPITVW